MKLSWRGVAILNCHVKWIVYNCVLCGRYYIGSVTHTYIVMLNSSSLYSIEMSARGAALPRSQPDTDGHHQVVTNCSLRVGSCELEFVSPLVDSWHYLTITNWMNETIAVSLEVLTTGTSHEWWCCFVLLTAVLCNFFWCLFKNGFKYLVSSCISASLLVILYCLSFLCIFYFVVAPIHALWKVLYTVNECKLELGTICQQASDSWTCHLVVIFTVAEDIFYMGSWTKAQCEPRSNCVLEILLLRLIDWFVFLKLAVFFFALSFCILISQSKKVCI